MDRNTITYFDAEDSAEQQNVRRVCICTLVDRKYDVIDPYRLLLFCMIPRSRQEIERYLHCKNAAKVRRKCVRELMALGLLQMTLPDKCNSKNQKFFAVIK